MNADYLEIKSEFIQHYGTKGQKKGIRRFQSYEVAPTQSGMVGQEVGEAAAQSRRVMTKEQESRVKSLYGKGGLKRVNEALDRGESYQGALHTEAVKRQHREAVKNEVKAHAKITSAALIAGIGSVAVADIMDSRKYTGGDTKRAARVSYEMFRSDPKKYLAKVGLATAVGVGLGEINRARHKLSR